MDEFTDAVPAGAGGTSSGGATSTSSGQAGSGTGGSGGCTADVDHDQLNCGACGHDCLGGACRGGVCQPFELVGNENEPTGIAVAGDQLYWTSIGSDTLRRCTLPDCSPTTLLPFASPWGIAAGNGRVYWTRSTGNATDPVSVCDPDDCTGTYASITQGGDPKGVAVTATDAYFLSQGPGSLRRCALGGCNDMPTALAPGNGSGLAIVGSIAYWTNWDNSRLDACTLPGCTDVTTLFAENMGALSLSNGLAVDATHAYWSSLEQIKHCALDDCANTVAALVPSTAAPAGVAVDAQAIYWTSPTAGTIMRLVK
ncbi:MAG TPA: hypothetical protein VFB62_11065 [Polyangiaceae bacterium]|nr:hypothetical protein [Polyangiaceae bacterium]